MHIFLDGRTQKDHAANARDNEFSRGIRYSRWDWQFGRQFHATNRPIGRVAVTNGPKTKEIFTAVTPQSPSISGLTHDHPSSVAHQQRKKPDPRPPQAAGALKIALLGAHGEHGPRGALKELDQSTLLLLLLSVLCTSHLQAIPRPCGCIEQRLYSPMHSEIIGPQIRFCATRSTRAEHSVST